MSSWQLFLLFLFVLILITRPFTVLFHELGHAFAAILLTKEKVTVYIGSYGDQQKTLKFNIGLLEVYFWYNPLFWRAGLCIPSARNIPANHQIIYTITGPVTSLIIASVACYFAFSYDLHGFLKLLFIVFFGSAVFDLLINLIPNKSPIKLDNGEIAYNDGYNLKLLFYYKRLPKECSEAINLYNERRFLEACILFEKMLSDSIADDNIFRLAIASHLFNKNYEKVRDISEQFARVNKMTTNDLSNMALSYSQLGFHERAMEIYDKALQLDPDHKYALNNKGYTLNLLNRYQDAISYFDKAIKLDQNFAYSYNNRGLAKIKTGKIEEGLNDINHSLELDSDNSYGYRNLGIYYFDQADHRQALELFLKAKDLDETTHMIDELINNAKNACG
jgi:tetratricopeptide (TPR) repeat protein